MVKKKGDDENKDLTRIEDLSEFLHQEDSDLDSRFNDFSPSFENNELSSTCIDLGALDETEDSPPALPDLPAELPEDGPADELGDELDDEPSDNFSFDEAPADENESETWSENPMESSGDAFAFDALDSLEETQNESNEYNESTESTPEFRDEFTAQSQVETDDVFTEEPDSSSREVYTHTSEKFEDVKTFAQNFSYGQVQGGGNPPYSIIVRHIKYQEEAEDILNLLKELGVVTAQTEKETLRAIELGSLIIPQISEFTAIVLAHKLRRFDLDLEVGLSDEVHPSKSGESNPRGLLKKDNLKQNKIESLKISEIDNSIKDIIISTTSSVQGYHVESYIGVQTTFAIVEEAELERLQYVQKSQRTNSELYDFENTETTELTSEKAFRDYQNSFALLYEDLTMQLKQKAFTQNANALLGLSFHLSPLNFERSHSRVSAYQITCSATLAILGRDNP